MTNLHCTLGSSCTLYTMKAGTRFRAHRANTFFFVERDIHFLEAGTILLTNTELKDLATGLTLMI